MAAWKDLILAAEREVCVGGSVCFGSGLERTLSGEEIVSLVIDEGADSALTPGAVLSAVCRVDLANDAGQWRQGGSMLGGQQLIGATLKLKLGARDGENLIWKALGAFQIESAAYIESEAVARLVCSDSISSELSEPFQDALSYPATLAQLWSAVVGQSRYVWEGSVPNGSSLIDEKPDWGNASLRSVMGMIAAAAGCFVCVDREGYLRLRSLVSERQYALCADDYTRLEADDIQYGPVDALRLRFSDSTKLYYADAEQSALHVAEVEGNPLFQKDAAHLNDLAQGMLSQIAGYQSGKADFSWRGDPEMCIGDRILLTDASGVRFSGILSRQSLRFDRRFQADCSCAVPLQTDSGVRRVLTPEGGLNAAALTGAINGELLSTGSVSTNKLAAGSVTAEKLAAGAVDAGAISALAGKIAQLTADDVQTDSLAAALAAFTVIAAGTAEFDRATIAHLVSQALNLEFGTANEAFIRNLRVAYAQMVQAAIGNLLIKASNGNYYRIDVDAEGKVSATQSAATESEIAAGQTQAGRVIVETEIAAENLSTANLLATYALVNRIDAARIDVDQLFARQAFVSKLLTTDISSNSYIQQSIVDAASGEVARYVRLDDAGLHVGETDASSEVLIDENGVGVVARGKRFSSFAANYVQFGDYQMRRTADGGMVFRRRGV